MDQLYGALMSYEGKPADTLVAYTGALERELGDVEGEFDRLRQGDLATANAALKAKGMRGSAPLRNGRRHLGVHGPALRGYRRD